MRISLTVLSLSASLVLIAISPVAHAGSTISDRDYWPGQPRLGGSAYFDSRPRAAFDAMPAASQGRVFDPRFSHRSGSYRYQGGPKSAY
jgi:hypothetical protein